jgi:hypothetical protein
LLRQRNRNKESQIIKYLGNTGIRIENTYKMPSFESLPREEGIGPTTGYLPNLSLSDERLPICSGMPPVILLSGNDLQYIHTRACA